jgi:cyclophilin family peptidyl-prolyl cis-trans isomerase
VQAPPAKPDGGQKPPKQKLDAGKHYSLVVQTNCGSFTIALDQKLAPRTGASLVSLARKGFFDRTIFHRIVPGFVIQGGDPTGTGTGGPGYKTVDRPPANARYVKGVVAMAKTQAEGPGTSGSQFFVVTGADVGLPPEYAIVGRVTKGIAVVDRIGQLGDAAEQPTQTVEIERVRVTVS